MRKTPEDYRRERERWADDYRAPVPCSAECGAKVEPSAWGLPVYCDGCRAALARAARGCSLNHCGAPVTGTGRYCTPCAEATAVMLADEQRRIDLELDKDRS